MIDAPVALRTTTSEALSSPSTEHQLGTVESFAVRVFASVSVFVALATAVTVLSGGASKKLDTGLWVVAFAVALPLGTFSASARAVGSPRSAAGHPLGSRARHLVVHGGARAAPGVRHGHRAVHRATDKGGPGIGAAGSRGLRANRARCSTSRHLRPVIGAAGVGAHRGRRLRDGDHDRYCSS